MHKSSYDSYCEKTLQHEEKMKQQQKWLMKGPDNIGLFLFLSQQQSQSVTASPSLGFAIIYLSHETGDTDFFLKVSDCVSEIGADVCDM